MKHVVYRFSEVRQARRFAMFGLTRWNSFDDVFNFQREVDRLFNQFWSDLPTRTAAGSSPSFQVNTTDDGWRVDVPLPGIDPKDVSLEGAGNNLTIRAEVPGEGGDKNVRAAPPPGIDPKDVALEVAGNNLTIRAEVPSEGGDKTVSRYEQTLMIPQFLDLEKLTASHRDGMVAR